MLFCGRHAARIQYVCNFAYVRSPEQYTYVILSTPCHQNAIRIAACSPNVSKICNVFVFVDVMSPKCNTSISLLMLWCQNTIRMSVCRYHVAKIQYVLQFVVISSPALGPARGREIKLAPARGEKKKNPLTFVVCAHGALTGLC